LCLCGKKASATSTGYSTGQEKFLKQTGLRSRLIY
jgi:hypothetical protein